MTAAVPLADMGLLVGAGVVAGVLGSAGGITSLISYPAILAVGIAPLPANVTMAVAFAACWPGSALGSRPELVGQGPMLRRWAPLIALGGVCGSILLLSTPDRIFGRIVPFLLALAALTLFFQPQLTSWRRGFFNRHGRLLLPVGLFGVSLYSGYFGAGSGVMVLLLILLMVDQELTRANALKNMLLGVADAVAAVIFIVWGPVNWRAAIPMAIGLLAGSMVGPSLTRRMPGTVVRVLVACCGLALAIRLWIVPA
ncbi:MAG TPA: sulfite exporter TauE/SafE family protein [Acidimicrobiales bacterium]|jgi:hypothetical protein|nr:sulfite exporter TauE/SafE family protein [Acidimicrobiales bacterium]